MAHKFTTRCICCGLQLKDAVSIERGVGPVCSKEHYEGYEPSPEQFEDAVGVLLTKQVFPDTLMAHLFEATKGRAFANHLTRWASENIANTEALLACGEILGKLGFKVLGEKILMRNTPVVITRGGLGYVVATFARPVTEHLLRRVPGLTAHTESMKGRRFARAYTFPENARGDVWAVLGVEFGGDWATVPGPDPGDQAEIRKIPYRGRSEVEAMLTTQGIHPAQPQTYVRNTRTPTISDNGDGTLTVAAPYHPAFIADLKVIKGRRWDPLQRVWVVPASEQARVELLIRTHF